MGAREIRTLIVDDEEDIRVLLRVTIESANQGLTVAAEAADGEDGIVQWRRHRPEVVILDQRMPGLSGLEVAARILAEEPDQGIVLFSAYLAKETVAEATSLGVRACVSKSDFSTLPAVLWQAAGAA